MFRKCKQVKKHMYLSIAIKFALLGPYSGAIGKTSQQRNLEKKNGGGRLQSFGNSESHDRDTSTPRAKHATSGRTQ